MLDGDVFTVIVNSKTICSTTKREEHARLILRLSRIKKHSYRISIKLIFEQIEVDVEHQTVV